MRRLHFGGLGDAKFPFMSSKIGVVVIVLLKERDGVGQHPFLGCFASEFQKQLVLKSRRASNDIPPLTAHPRYTKDGAVWKKAENIFENLGGVECSAARNIDGHGTSDAA